MSLPIRKHVRHYVKLMLVVLESHGVRMDISVTFAKAISYLSQRIITGSTEDLKVIIVLCKKIVL